MTTLADIAPRLARAHAAHRALLRAEDRQRLRLIRKISHHEWLVGHRDLQLARAGSTRRAARSADYMASRHRKLVAAERELARLRDQLAHLADWRKPR